MENRPDNESRKGAKYIHSARRNTEAVSNVVWIRTETFRRNPTITIIVCKYDC